MANVNTAELEVKVQEIYRHVAQAPNGAYHFEVGRPLAERLGYPADMLDRLPVGAVESFAGVGYFFDLADLSQGERVIDLGSGSGMDAFAAAQLVGPSGRVLGLDFSVEQLAKARRLAAAGGFDQVEFVEGRIERLPVEDESFDCVISNGVINLSRQGTGIRRGGAGTAARWPARHCRHRHRAAVDRGDRQQRRPVGLLHRRRCPAGLLSSCDRGRRHARRGNPPKPLRVPLRPGPQRQRKVRRQERLSSRRQAWPNGPGSDT